MKIIEYLCCRPELIFTCKQSTTTKVAYFRIILDILLKEALKELYFNYITYSMMRLIQKCDTSQGRQQNYSWDGSYE